MRRSNTQSLSQVIRDYLKATQMDSKLKEVKIINSWEEIIGKSVANATSEMYIKNSKLYVHLTSSVVRNELAMIKSGIIKRINELAEEKLITDIVLR